MASARVLSLSQRAGLKLPPLASEVLSFWFGDHPAWPAAGLPKSTNAEDVRAAWLEGLSPASMKRWYMGGEEMDRDVRSRFGAELEKLVANDRSASYLLDWVQLENPRAGVAAVVLVDQLTRNAFRGSAKCFALDPLARDMTKTMLQRPDINDLRLVERTFLLLPLEHSEDIKDHDQLESELQRLRRACEAEGSPEDLAKLVEGMAKYAEEHSQVVRRFGRYPHRNKVLGRETTAEESDFLTKADTWGQ